MKLYYAPGACSLAVHIALREIGADFETLAVDLAKQTTADGTDFRTVSPRGYVPLLQLDDGTHRTEAAPLLQYVADLDPSQALIGLHGTDRRLAVIEWLGFIATELHKMFSPWLWHKDTADSTRQFVKDKLHSRFEELDGLLANQDYLTGAFSVADAYAFTIINWVNFLALPISRYSNLGSYVRRVAERPSVQEAMRTEGLIK
ncbi:glutathione transferase GstA [Zoogloea sp.]|uniref:glutathione transferase GstA n=1 Tax=Zoogloea sp. TaxID=49181 RepID=UPI0035AEC2C0